ncbi:ATPase AAA-type core [Penicillium majusculum]|nr:ATPase AAA-type core [Penicillium majusculum]
MIGLDAMKNTRKLDEKPLIEYSLNKIFLGNPGTGKTSIVKIYDFVSSVVGESERNTKGILASTIGKVLVIDEAYRLFTGGISDGAGSQSDSYRTAVIDTLVAEVQSTPGDDRYILLLGYKELIEEMFQRVNPGLSRRFPMDQAFVFDDFTSSELDAILILKLKE